MTVFIVQCPHLGDAKVWTASDEKSAIAAITGDGDSQFDSLIEAAKDDMRTAYVTEDALDLYLWCSYEKDARATRAATAVLRNREARSEIAEVATRHDLDDDTTVYRAFGDEFVWKEDEEEWTLGNREPVACEDLVRALADASLIIALRDKMERTDV